jgi:4-amino-4-deoxy-L-arabinose transferase-like glycosyltransferase
MFSRVNETAARLRAFLGDPARRPWLLAALATVTRVASGLTARIIHADSPRFLRMATLIGEGKFGEACRVPPFSHPLYPTLVAFGELFEKNQLVVAVAIAAVLGGLAAVPLFHLARAAWGERVGTIAALLYAFLPDPVELHGHALPEGPFYFFFLTTMALAWSALEKKSWERALLAGATATCAWLSRAEGVYVLLLFLFAVACRPNRFSVAALGIFLVTAFVLAFPYLTFIRAETGKWGVSAIAHAKGVFGLITGETKATGYGVDPSVAPEDQPFSEYKYIARYGKVLGPVFYILKTCAADLFYVLAPFVILGFVFLRTPEIRWGPASYLVVAGIGYSIPPCLAFVAGTPFSYRYILPAMVFFLPVAAVGLVKAAGWVRWRHALAVFLVVVFAAMTPRFLRPKNTGKIAIKQAGIALLQTRGPGVRILGTRREIEFYARGEFFELPLPPTTLEEIRRIVDSNRVEVVALFEPDLKNCPPGTKEYVEERFKFFGEYPLQPAKNAAPMRLYVRPR